ncbi:MAG: sugar phosphate isomerase/epimerase [Clostridia bacterium]|nr:sugar phosphate isomerase/epimerase [Clostridia bacterium]
MSVGVSTACFYPNLTEKSVEYLAKNGVNQIEIFFNSQSETNVRFLSKIKKIADLYKMKIVAVHSYFCSYEPYLIFSDYERRFDDCLPFVDSLFDAGAVLQADYAIIHGGRLTGKISDEVYFERFLTIYNRGIEVGVKLAQENVNQFRSSSPTFISHMKRYLGEKANFVLDVKQCVRSGVDIYQMADAMGDSLKHIHLSDHNNKLDCMLPLKGNFDFKSFLNYSDTIKNATKMVEVYNNAYENFDEVINSTRQLEALIY